LRSSLKNLRTGAASRREESKLRELTASATGRPGHGDAKRKKQRGDIELALHGEGTGGKKCKYRRGKKSKKWVLRQKIKGVGV